MTTYLIVAKPFDSAARGDTVTNSAPIAQTLSSKWHHSMVRVQKSKRKGG